MLIICLFILTLNSPQPVSAVTFTVNSNFDTPDQNPADGACNDGSGKCTLRAAIMETNILPGADVITFDSDLIIDVSTAPLPALSDPDGTTIRVGMRLVTIDGSNAGVADGLTLSSNNNKVQGLTIRDFSGNGVKITGSNNIIGVDSDGSNDAQEFNQIYSNGGNGIYVSGSNNRIAGNYIGQTLFAANKPNNLNGIHIAGGSNNLIGVNGDGVSDSIEGNKISYNLQDGIVDNGPSNIIAGNTIVNNLQNGILITLTGNTLIGTNGDGVSDILEGNRISGNQKNGIKVFTSHNVTIAGNKIGVNETGTGAHFNYDYGIYLESSNFTLIGTDGEGVGAANEGNLISGSADGQVYALYTFGTVIAGNKIGTELTGTLAIPSAQGFGIKLENSNSNPLSLSTIGTNDDGYGDAIEANLISGNTSDGIQIKNSNSNTIKGNTIGLAINGLTPLPNLGNGIILINSSTDNHLINNVISGNNENGVLLNGANNNRIRSNRIGTNAAGTAAIANVLNGVLIQNCDRNVIGPDSPGAITSADSNLISGNSASGIKFEGTSTNTDRNRVYNNRIGTTLDGTQAIPNSVYGVHLIGAYTSSNTIQSNLIAHNTSYAVKLDGTADTYGNTITQNSMINNLGGISIQGAEGNDNKDPDDGPNGKQNFPALQAAERDGNILGLTLDLNSSPSELFFIHVYLTRSCREYQTDFNQGEAYIGTGSVTTDANGIVSAGISFELPSDYRGKGTYLLATATSFEGSTSEFSNCIQGDGLYNWLYMPVIQR
jgi:parallel beta-helix repeat protein